MEDRPSVRVYDLPEGALALKPDGRIFGARDNKWRRLDTVAAGGFKRGRSDSDLDSSENGEEGAGAGGAGGAGGGAGGRGSKRMKSEEIQAFIRDATHDLIFRSKVYPTDEDIMIEAAKKGRVDVLEHLSAKGVDFSVRSSFAAVWAARYGHLNVLEFLEDKPGIDFSARDNDVQRTAAIHGHLHVLEFLEGKGVNFSAQNNASAIGAAGNGHLHVLEFLEGQPGVVFHTWNNAAATQAANIFNRRADVVLSFLGKQPGVRLAAALREYPKWRELYAERRPWEKKQDAFVASARSGSLTEKEVRKAKEDKLIFRELELERGLDSLDLDPAVRALVDAQIAKEYNEVAWRKGSSRPLLAHWGDHRKKARDGIRGGAGGNELFETWKNLPRAAVAEVFMQRHGGEL